jgi:hypothetical protein
LCVIIVAERDGKSYDILYCGLWFARCVACPNQNTGVRL